ncbi:MAG: hypothetical protein ABL993_07710 [Vicinamibacterales bacterium]
MNPRDDTLDDQGLNDLLADVARRDAGVGAPQRVEEAVLRAWDARSGSRPSRSWVGGRAFWGTLAAAACLVFGFVIAGRDTMRTGERVEGLVSESSSVPAAGAVDARYDTLTWLDADPASLQIVRLRVESATLAAEGYTIADPDGDGMIDLEMIVSVEGVARSIRVDPPASSAAQ